MNRETLEIKLNETKQVLTPQKERTQPNGGGVLRMQILLSLIIFGLLLALGHFAPALRQELLETYRTYMSHNDYSAQPIVRFASSIVEQVRPVAAMGGSGQSKKPWNYSTESYKPDAPLAQPLGWYEVTSRYGWRKNPTSSGKDFHTGIDLATAEGTPIKAAKEGVVVKAGWSNSYGNYIVVSHAEHLMTLYAHMQYLFVRTGQPVTQGQLLGTVGQTGNVTGPHLHFELIYKDIGYDPGRALGI